MARILADPIVDALIAAGIADNNTRRVVIDLKVCDIPLIYIERFGGDELISVVQTLNGVEVKYVKPDASGAGGCAQAPSR